MFVVVLEDGSRVLFASEDDEWAIAAANPGCDTWSPTWRAFDVTGPRLDFGGIEATLEAAIEARRRMAEQKPAERECREPEARTVAWWDEQATRSGIKRPRFRGPARGRFPCLCAQLVDCGVGSAFAMQCITDAKARLVAERGCRILGTERGSEVWARAAMQVAVAFHDERLDRVTGDSGSIAGRTRAELGSIRVGGREPIRPLRDQGSATPTALKSTPR